MAGEAVSDGTAGSHELLELATLMVTKGADVNAFGNLGNTGGTPL